jgi:hypothetical protein
MSTGHIEFTRGAIRPFQCLSDGWQLIKDRYWLFLGITVVGVLIGSLAPLGILMGPCMCGIHYCMIRQQEGKSVEFGMLFKGFDYFVQSLIATLIMLIPMMILIIPFYIVFLIVMLKAMPDQRHNPHPDPKALMTFFGTMGGFFLFIFCISILVHIVFFFVYPLIVDRRLGGVEAVKVSAGAAFANFWSVLGLTLLNGLLGLLGVMCCYVGAFFVMPIGFAAVWTAYRQVFPEELELAAVAPEVS